jgi:hypothetical protein
MEELESQKVFISSCSRRQLARRRHRGVLWLWGRPAVMTVAAVLAGYVAARGGI